MHAQSPRTSKRKRILNTLVGFAPAVVWLGGGFLILASLDYHFGLIGEGDRIMRSSPRAIFEVWNALVCWLALVGLSLLLLLCGAYLRDDNGKSEKFVWTVTRALRLVTLVLVIIGIVVALVGLGS